MSKAVSTPARADRIENVVETLSGPRVLKNRPLQRGCLHRKQKERAGFVKMRRPVGGLGFVDDGRFFHAVLAPLTADGGEPHLRLLFASAVEDVPFGSSGEIRSGIARSSCWRGGRGRSWDGGRVHVR